MAAKKLVFKAEDVKKVVALAIEKQTKVSLVKDQGIYLLVLGHPNSVTYAKGCGPKDDYESYRYVGGDGSDFHEMLPVSLFTDLEERVAEGYGVTTWILKVTAKGITLEALADKRTSNDANISNKGFTSPQNPDMVDSNSKGEDTQERRKNMSKINESMTKAQLVEHFNKINGSSFAVSTFSNKAAVLERIAEVETAKAEEEALNTLKEEVGDKGWRTIREAAEELLMQDEPALAYDEILARIKAVFPKAKTTFNCLRWYASHMREEVVLPDRPRSTSK